MLLELHGSEKPIKARKRTHLLIGDPVTVKDTELLLEHRRILLVRHGEQGNRLFKALTHVIQTFTEPPIEDRLILTRVDLLNALIHRERILDLKDATTEHLLDHARRQITDDRQKVLRESAHIDLHAPVDETITRSARAVLVVLIPLPIGIDEGCKGLIVLSVQLSQRLDHDLRIRDPVPGKGLERHLIRLHLEVSHDSAHSQLGHIPGHAIEHRSSGRNFCLFTYLNHLTPRLCGREAT